MKNKNPNYLPAWQFTARKYEPPGKKVTGIIYAYTLEEVRDELEKQGLVPTRITLKREKVNWRLTQKIAVTKATFEKIIREERLRPHIESGQISLFFPDQS